jgi:hypothetical protein
MIIIEDGVRTLLLILINSFCKSRWIGRQREIEDGLKLLDVNP